MTDLSLKLSAYLDGELGPDETDQIDALLKTDPDAQAELDALIAAQVAAQEQFDTQLQYPVPLKLVQQLNAIPAPQSAANRPARPIWGSLAASLVALVIGGAGGYLYSDSQSAPPPAGWLVDIADYHAVYAGQTRHLVEVGADESDHIEAWLGKVVGTQFTIPDLTAFDLTFEGGRLVVANGKPVAQLMYSQPDGTVVALCLQPTDLPGGGLSTLAETTINGFDFVSWRANSAAYVVVGPEGQSNLTDIAAHAALDI